MVTVLHLLVVDAAILGLVSVAHTSGHHHMVATGGHSPAETVDDERVLIRSNDCDAGRYPCLRPAVFALDVMVPGLDLGEDERWSVRTGRGAWEQTSIVRVLLSLMRVAGWLLVGLLVIGGANVVFEQRRQG